MSTIALVEGGLIRLVEGQDGGLQPHKLPVAPVPPAQTAGRASLELGIGQVMVDGAPCPAEPEGATEVGVVDPALADLVLELEVQASIRRGPGRRSA